MEAKKSQKADLEKKSPVFFLLGLALSLLAVLVVIQIEKQKTTSQLKGKVTIEASLASDVPITIRKVKEMPEVNKEESKINTNLPPEVVPDEKLIWDNIFKDKSTEGDELEDIPLEPLIEDEVETIDFMFIEKMARPKECEKYGSIDEQKACLNSWIQKYLSTNVKYPEISKRMRSQDRVYVTFVISEKGEVESAWVERGQYEALNEEALKVVKGMPDFIPGSQHNKPVKMKMTIPVNFKLSSF